MVCVLSGILCSQEKREAFPGLLWTDLQDILDGGKSKGQSSRHSSHLASERNKRGQNTRTYVCLFSYMCVYFLKVRINQNLFKMVYSLPLKNLQGGRDRQGEVRFLWMYLLCFTAFPVESHKNILTNYKSKLYQNVKAKAIPTNENKWA